MRLDIMMPFYGDPELFKKAVQSVREQTDGGWHLTVIDDVYPDLEPGRWCAALDDPRVTYLRNEVNLGVGGNFQRSVDLMTEAYGVIVGCDDLMHPDYVARVRSLIIANPGIAYVHPGVTVIDSAGAAASASLTDRIKSLSRFRADGSVYSGEKLAASLMKGNWTYFPALCWRTDLLKRHGFRTEFSIVLDLAMQIDILIDGGAMLLDGVPVFDYRRHAGSVSSWRATDGSRFDEEKRYFREMATHFSSIGWKRAARAARLHLTSRLNAVTRIPAALKAGDRRGAGALIAHALT